MVVLVLDMHALVVGDVEDEVNMMMMLVHLRITKAAMISLYAPGTL